MNNTDIENLFKRFCSNKNVSSQDAVDIEVSIHEFTEALGHDLIRALYLNKLTDEPISFPNPVAETQALLNLISIEDPHLKIIKDRDFSLGEDLKSLLETERKYYALVLHEDMQLLQKDPTEKTLSQILNNFNLENWKNTIKEISKLTYVDEIYDQGIKTFLEEMTKGLAMEDINDAAQTMLSTLLPVLYRLTRRGEVGLELIVTCYQCRQSLTRLSPSSRPRWDEVTHKVIRSGHRHLPIQAQDCERWYTKRWILERGYLLRGTARWAISLWEMQCKERRKEMAIKIGKLERMVNNS